MVTARDDERLALLFSQSLKRAGIAARVRVVDAVQFEGRRLNYDFDMIENRWEQSLSPGNEQSFYWGSAAADQPGTRNYMGIKSAAVDAMIAALLKAQTREKLVAAVRALDRVLLSGFYTIPLFHLPEQWLARWTRIARPARRRFMGTFRNPAGERQPWTEPHPPIYARPAATRIMAVTTSRRAAQPGSMRWPDALALLDAPTAEYHRRPAVSVTGKPTGWFPQSPDGAATSGTAYRRHRCHPDGKHGGERSPFARKRAGLTPMPLCGEQRGGGLSRVGATALIVTGGSGRLTIMSSPCRWRPNFSTATSAAMAASTGWVGPLRRSVHDRLDPIPAWDEERAADPGPGAHLALVTWDVSADGLVPVARSHIELIASGLAVMLESRLQRDAVLLSTLTLASIAGLATAMVPCLLVGGTLALHQPFDPEVYGAQLRTIEFDSACLWDLAPTQLAENALFMSARFRDVLAVWRAPERLTQPHHGVSPRLDDDILVFGEIGLIAACRPGGKPSVIPSGLCRSPRAEGQHGDGEIAATSIGTVACVVRWCRARHSAKQAQPGSQSSCKRIFDTGYACRSDIPAPAVTGPPA
jgi:hypothetical protein